MKKYLIIPILMNMIMLNLISLASAHTGEDDINHCGGFCPMMSGAYGGLGMFFGWAFSILILVALVLFIVWIIKQIQKDKTKKKKK